MKKYVLLIGYNNVHGIYDTLEQIVDVFKTEFEIDVCNIDNVHDIALQCEMLVLESTYYPEPIYVRGQVPVEEMSIEETIHRYFQCIFGDGYTLVQVLTFKELDNFLKHHKITIEFLVTTIKNRKNGHNSN